MKPTQTFLPAFLSGAMMVCITPALAIAQQEKRSNPSAQPVAQQYAEMMKRAKRFTQPGKHHKVLERMIGQWNTETRIFMAGKPLPPEKGTAKTSWLMNGRWLKTISKSTMIGQPMETFSIMGYDNFKMSYVVTTVNSIDTTMVRQEGDVDPSGKSLLAYGTLDEYTTGEHDKMVKTVWRFVDKDKIIMEIHDLPIGEKNTKVVEVVYTRKQSER